MQHQRLCEKKNRDTQTLGVGHLRKPICVKEGEKTVWEGLCDKEDVEGRKTRKDIWESECKDGCKVTGEHYITGGGGPLFEQKHKTYT